MKNEIYNYLGNYFDTKTNSTQYEVERLNKHFKNLERFLKSGLITEEQKDLLVADMCTLIDYVVKVISKCPNLEIHLKNIIKEPKHRIRKEKTYTQAIGFEYPTEEDYDDYEDEYEKTSDCDSVIDNS